MTASTAAALLITANGKAFTITIKSTTTAWADTKLVLGPRTRREIELRIVELEHRDKKTVFDLAEAARLRELLRDVGAGQC